METDDQLLERFHTLTAQEARELGARIEAKFQAKLNAMSPTEKQEMARSIQDALGKYYQG